MLSTQNNDHPTTWINENPTTSNNNSTTSMMQI